MKKELSQVINAIDKLNSYVRSTSYKSHHISGPLGAVYEMKRWAMIAAKEQGLDWQHRFIYSAVICRNCEGTGNYNNSYSDDDLFYEECRTCSGTGTAHLYFIETTIDIGRSVKWHTPRHKFPFYATGIDASTGDYIKEKNWTPNYPGHELTSIEVAQYLNIAEEYFEEKIKEDLKYDHFTFKYCLYIGETEKEICSLCGAAALPGAQVVTRFKLYWRDHCCKQCHQHFDVFQRFSLPQYLINEDIKKWMDRVAARSNAEWII